MENKLRWLHISDLHLKKDTQMIENVVLSSFLKSLPSLIKKYGYPNIIFVTGDIAYSGNSAEYKMATTFFEELLEITQLERKDIYIVPGNHDVDRAEAVGLARTLNNQQEIDNFHKKNKYETFIDSIQSSFIKWYNEFYEGVRVFEKKSSCSDPLIINVNGVTIEAVLANSAVFSRDNSDIGKLIIGRTCLNNSLDKINNLNSLKILLMHHPLNWLSEIESINIKSTIRNKIDCLLLGHMHQNEVESIIGMTGENIVLQSGALSQGEDIPNTAMICEYCDGRLRIIPITYFNRTIPLWTLDPAFFPNNEDYHGVFDVTRFRNPTTAISEENKSLTNNLTDIETSKNNLQIEKTKIDILKSEFEEELFSINGIRLYAEPKIMDCAQDLNYGDASEANHISVSEIINSEESFLIEVRSEYGATTLCKLLNYEINRIGIKCCYVDAKTLPNYRAKFEAFFGTEYKSEQNKSVLIIDNVEIEQNERLLKELQNTKWFSRVVAFNVSRGIQNNKPVDIKSLPFQFRSAFMWSMSREQIRAMTSQYFETDDYGLISEKVDKIYQDLNALCIPLIPSNVIMYMKIIKSDTNYQPLNKVEIVQKHLTELLQKPSDVSKEAFNVKNKLDLLGELSYEMFKDEISCLDESYWYSFCKKYQKRTANEFDEASLLREILDMRIFIKWNKKIYLKYSFYHSYFLGRHISNNKKLLAQFLEKEEYHNIPSVVEVITGIQSDNSEIVLNLTNKLDKLIIDFETKYMPRDVDPFKAAQWISSSSEEETVWNPVKREIDNNTIDINAIDNLKKSPQHEARAMDQAIYYSSFYELESAIFSLSNILSEALKNADESDAEIKEDAMNAVFKCHQIALQIGLLHAKEIATSSYYRWHGIAFIGGYKAIEGLDSDSPEAIFAIAYAIYRAISRGAGEQLGSKKLIGILRIINEKSPNINFFKYMLFECIIQSRGRNWEEAISKTIKSTDRNEFYLFIMLNSMMWYIKNEVLSLGDREKMKTLVAEIQAKRTLKKNSLGAKAIKSIRTRMDSQNYFQDKI